MINHTNKTKILSYFYYMLELKKEQQMLQNKKNI